MGIWKPDFRRCVDGLFIQDAYPPAIRMYRHARSSAQCRPTLMNWRGVEIYASGSNSVVGFGGCCGCIIHHTEIQWVGRLVPRPASGGIMVPDSDWNSLQNRIWASQPGTGAATIKCSARTYPASSEPTQLANLPSTWRKGLCARNHKRRMSPSALLTVTFISIGGLDKSPPAPLQTRNFT